MMASDDVSFVCSACGKAFSRKFNCGRHVIQCSEKNAASVLQAPRNVDKDVLKCIAGDQQWGKGVEAASVPNFSGSLTCKKCGFTSDMLPKMIRHVKSKHGVGVIIDSKSLAMTKAKLKDARKAASSAKRDLGQARKELSKKTTLLSKLRGKQGGASFRHRLCRICQRVFENKKSLLDHLIREHNPERGKKYSFQLTDSAFKSSILRYELFDDTDLDKKPRWPSIESIFQIGDDNSRELIAFYLTQKISIVIQIGIAVLLTKAGPEEENPQTEPFFFLLPRQRLFSHQLDKGISFVSDFLGEEKQKLSDRLSHLEEVAHSGWNLNRVRSIYINIYDGTRLFDGKSRLLLKNDVTTFLSRHFVSYKTAFESFVSYRQDCLLTCIATYFLGGDFRPYRPDLGLRTLERIKKPGNPPSLKAMAQFVREKLKVPSVLGDPIGLAELGDFERANAAELDFRLNVHLYEEEDGVVVPYVVSQTPFSEAAHTIHLLLICVAGQYHYVLISRLGLIRLRLASGKKNSHTNNHACEKCFLKFSRKCHREKHETQCFFQSQDADEVKNGQFFAMPPEGASKSFTNYHKTMPAPFLAAADLEAAMVRPSVSVDTKNRKAICEQVPVCFGLTIIETKTNRIVFHRVRSSQENCMSLFFQALEEARDLLTFLSKRFMTHNVEPSRVYELKRQATQCYICRKDFSLSFEQEQKIRRSGGELLKKSIPAFRVLDHCHVYGDYLGIAHSRCNLMRRLRVTEIPIMIHNLSNYDQSFIVGHFRKLSEADPNYFRQKVRASGLVKNSEKFRVINLMGTFKLVDSMGFLSSSLDKAVNNLKAGDHTFPILRQTSLGSDEKKVEYCTRKGVFCYSQLKSIEDFESRTCLPPRKDFYNDLAKKECSLEDYRHAQEVFRYFECANLKDYLELYQAIDVFLLLEVVMQFRKLIMDRFGLDMLHYISLPSLSFDCFLKMSGVKIELLHDKETFQLLRGSILGGLSFARQRYAEATTPEEHIAYFDGGYFPEIKLLPLASSLCLSPFSE